MLETWKESWNVQLADILDICIIAVLLAFMLRWWSRRRRPSLLIGFVFLAAMYGAAVQLELYMLRSLMQVGFPILTFALLVFFQEELRFELERLRSCRFWNAQTDVHGELVETLTKAICLLADQRIGALLVIPRRQSIERFTRSGVELQAMPSVELIHSLFHPGSRGHDGAVIINSGRLARFGVHLPLSGNADKIRQLGTRHTAALGLAERTDAVVLVVSEETGAISIACDGELTSVEATELSQHLNAYVHDGSVVEASPARRLWGKRLATGVLSLSLAVMVWYVFAFRVQTVQRTLSGVVVELHRVPEQVTIHGPTPGTVELTLSGPQRVLEGLQPDQVTAVIDLQYQSQGLPWVRISRRHFKLAEDVELLSVEPEFVRVELIDVPKVVGDASD